MNSNNLTFTYLVDQSPMEVFNAVNNVRGWWGEAIEGATENVGDEFIYRHGDMHYSKQKLVEVVPGKKVVWLITDSWLTFIADKTEWNGTTISFDISEKDGKTELQFTHHGLTRELECFTMCSGGWNHYANKSLYSLITTGKGNPDVTTAE